MFRAVERGRKKCGASTYAGFLFAMTTPRSEDGMCTQYITDCRPNELASTNKGYFSPLISDHVGPSRHEILNRSTGRPSLKPRILSTAEASQPSDKGVSTGSCPILRFRAGSFRKLASSWLVPVIPSASEILRVIFSRAYQLVQS